MIFEGLSTAEAILVAALFGVPMLITVVVYTLIRRRGTRPVYRKPTESIMGPLFASISQQPLSAEEDQKWIAWEQKYGKLGLAILCFVTAVAYYGAATSFQEGTSTAINSIAGFLLLFCGKDIPTIGIALVGVYFLIRGTIDILRYRDR